MISNNKYQMWLTFNGEKQKLRLPVLPEKITVSMGTKDQSVDIAGLGEILVAQNRPALEFKFSSFFPASAFPGITAEKITEPKAIVEKITKWKNSDKPVHFIVTKLGIDVYCRITRFSITESGGDVGTLSYDITLKEYREPKVRQVKVNISTQSATVSQNTSRVDNTTPPQTYTVQKGDCLWTIAKKFYGNGAKYPIIYEANKSIIGGINDYIYTGQVFVIPTI